MRLICVPSENENSRFNLKCYSSRYNPVIRNTYWSEYAPGGKAFIERSGKNHWINDTDGYKHSWLVLNGAWEENHDAMHEARIAIADEIDELLCEKPVHKKL